ncbi:hypothetical protein NDA16_002577 [Ustilago loliicola]|nr:hypothetical protein NDA16_002577 [Ustilago loliicola]
MKQQKVLLDSSFFAAAFGMPSSDVLPDARIFAAAYCTASDDMEALNLLSSELYHSQPAYFQTPEASMQQPQQSVSGCSTPSTCGSMDEDLKQYFTSISLPDTSSRLQDVTGTSSLSQRISAPLFLEPLSYGSALSSSLSSPTLSASSSSSSLSTPISECFPELSSPLSATFPTSISSHYNNCDSAQIHFHNFAGGLELYNVPCMASAASTPTTLNLMEDPAMATPAPSAGSWAFSSPEHSLLPLPATFNFETLLESAVASSTLSGAFA